jgi:hypothetical protein
MTIMDDAYDAASVEAQDARAAEDARQAAERETAHQAAPAAEPGSVLAHIEAWFAQWYPETTAADHPAAPFTGARLHAQHAFEDLKGRLSAL